MAWKVRVAGSLPFSRAGTARATISASRRVVTIGSMERSRRMARTMRRAKRSSP